MTIMDVVVEEEEVRSRGILNQTRLGGEGGYKKKVGNERGSMKPKTRAKEDEEEEEEADTNTE